ncbi:MAG: energy transducer TonB [Bacteroidia bacterium]|nr:energy transducer TonB [Bacteroidia bacterium]HQV00236.1 energy transducer TonB [Bacteroidia bacterium]
MKKITKNSFIKRTSFPGGLKALRQFFDDHLIYPQAAIDAKISGTVTVKFNINYKGVVFDAHLVNSLGFGCDDEALRLVSLLQYNKTLNRGLHVVFHETIHIHFSLQKYLQSKTALQPLQTIVYHYQTEKPKNQTTVIQVNYQVKD